jgi:hypothetical protein
MTLLERRDLKAQKHVQQDASQQAQHAQAAPSPERQVVYVTVLPEPTPAALLHKWGHYCR